MNFICCKLKKLKKHEFHFWWAYKTSKNMNSFFASRLKNLKTHELHFLQPLKKSKNMNFIFASSKNLKKHVRRIHFWIGNSNWKKLRVTWAKIGLGAASHISIYKRICHHVYISWIIFVENTTTNRTDRKSLK